MLNTSIATPTHWKIMLNPEKHISIDELRKISLSSINAVLTNSFCDSLETGLPKRKIQENLISIWSITDSETARYIIEWLLTDGQDVLYEHIKSLIDEDDLSKAKEELKKLSRNSEYIRKYEKYIENIFLFKKHYPQVDFTEKDFQRGIKAWDISRAVFIARMCLDIKYINTRQFEDYLQLGTLEARNRYNSWKEYA
ncbi:MAG TPA: DUF1266 domain-containing protein, partial [Cytophagales bacterium]|nr:DUF1266 domain-containing protein [Cytophagales bacterium]